MPFRRETVTTTPKRSSSDHTIGDPTVPTERPTMFKNLRLRNRLLIAFWLIGLLPMLVAGAAIPIAPTGIRAVSM